MLFPASYPETPRRLDTLNCCSVYKYSYLSSPTRSCSTRGPRSPYSGWRIAATMLLFHLLTRGYSSNNTAPRVTGMHSPLHDNNVRILREVLRQVLKVKHPPVSCFQVWWCTESQSQPAWPLTALTIGPKTGPQLLPSSWAHLSTPTLQLHSIWSPC